MKLKVFLLLLSAFVLGTSQAAEVSKEKAVSIARDIMADRASNVDCESAEVKAVTYEGITAYYIVQFSKGGWALISADDMSSPLIGYSDTGKFQTENQPVNMQGMMDVYCQQISRNAQLRHASPHKDWESLPSKTRSTRAADNKIAPIISVTWNQSGNYKKYCPKDANGQAVVGCVAVGMAQAMSVAQYPPRPYGSHSYSSSNYGSMFIDYDKEPDYNWTAILSGANAKDDVARFLYHCGMAVDMDYGVDGSGTQTSYIPGALKRNFGYPDCVKYYTRSGYSGDWQDLILTELREGRAVAYSGHDPKKNYGHCFNLDGYDGSFFHVNWGWGGSNDGYFGLDGLRDNTMDMDYTDNQGVVVGVRAPSENPSDIYLSNNSVKSMQPAGTAVGDITVVSEATNPTYTFSIKGEYSVLFHTYLPAPFQIVNGVLVTTEEINADEHPEGITIEITATNDQNKASVTRHFTINITGASGIEETMKGEAEVVSESIYSPTGELLSSPRKGINIIRKRMADGSVKGNKIIIP